MDCWRKRFASLGFLSETFEDAVTISGDHRGNSDLKIDLNALTYWM